MRPPANFPSSCSREAGEVVDLFAGEAERFGVLAGFKLQRQNAHADEIRAVNALEAFGDDGAHAEQLWALGGPVARGAGAVLLAGEDDERDAALGVFDAGVEDGHLLCLREGGA